MFHMPMSSPMMTTMLGLFCAAAGSTVSASKKLETASAPSASFLRPCSQFIFLSLGYLLQGSVFKGHPLIQAIVHQRAGLLPRIIDGSARRTTVDCDRGSKNSRTSDASNFPEQQLAELAVPRGKDRRQQV